MSASRNVSRTGGEAVDLDSLEVGDLLEMDRTLYQHWAVFIGNGEVVHLTGDGRSSFGFSSSASTSSTSTHQGAEAKIFDKAAVKREKLSSVIGDSSYKVDNGRSKFTPQEIRKRALSKVGQSGYHVLFQNCEHFAKWCRYDFAFSWQTLTMGNFK